MLGRQLQKNGGRLVLSILRLQKVTAIRWVLFHFDAKKLLVGRGRQQRGIPWLQFHNRWLDNCGPTAEPNTANLCHPAEHGQIRFREIYRMLFVCTQLRIQAQLYLGSSAATSFMCCPLQHKYFKATMFLLSRPWPHKSFYSASSVCRAKWRARVSTLCPLLLRPLEKC